MSTPRDHCGPIHQSYPPEIDPASSGADEVRIRESVTPVTPKPSWEPTCHPSVGAGYQSTKTPKICTTDAVALPEASLGPPVNCPTPSARRSAPPSTRPRAIVPPKDALSAIPVPEMEAFPKGPLPHTDV
jgi:hypothetical protein